MKKKYALVGAGGRARFFYDAIAGMYKENAKLVAFCDLNQTRMDYANKVIQDSHGIEPVRTYKPDQFAEMIHQTSPDTIIVTSIDRTHHQYIIQAMEMGCDVISEKPMTVDEEKCQLILDTVKRTGRKLIVTFNLRYAPLSTKVKELIMSGAIGDIHSVHFEWLLDTTHGADYFRRWHRDKRNSGGLFVHKSTHHFDLVNFWLGSDPHTVFAMGDLLFYGRENAEKRGITEFYYRSQGSEAAKSDPFSIQLEAVDKYKDMFLDAEHEDGYIRDQSVFSDGISIEDTMGVMVRYANKAILTYSLNTYMPWEGFSVMMNGSKGRLQVQVAEKPYHGSTEKHKSITVHPMFEKPYEVEWVEHDGEHGGGDPVLLEQLFGEASKAEDIYGRQATHIDGAKSILIGIAGNRSMQTGLPVHLSNLVQF